MPEMSRFESAFCRGPVWRTFAGRVVLPWALKGHRLHGDVLEIGGEAVRVLRPGGMLIGYDLIARHPALWLHQAEGVRHPPDDVRAASGPARQSADGDDGAPTRPRRVGGALHGPQGGQPTLHRMTKLKGFMIRQRARWVGTHLSPTEVSDRPGEKTSLWPNLLRRDIRLEALVKCDAFTPQDKFVNRYLLESKVLHKLYEHDGAYRKSLS